MAQRKTSNEQPSSAWRFVIVAIVLGAFFFIATMLAIIIALVGSDLPSSGNVAMIDVHGVIVVGDGFVGNGVVTSEQVIDELADADRDATIKAIILDINSPGGSAVASDEIGQAIARINKTTVALIREVGASGGYWIAANTDHIIANRMSITGSIGVTSSYLGFAGLMDRYNVSYNRLVSGPFKDMGSPFKPLTSEERALFEQKLDRIHAYFVEEVANGRGLERRAVDELATGELLLGVEAFDAGLVDELGSLEEAKAFIEQSEGITVSLVEYERKVSLYQLLTQVLSERSYWMGAGLGDALGTQTMRI